MRKIVYIGDMDITESMGRRIRERRESRGLNQQDIANTLQISPQSVSKWERGQNAPDIGMLPKLASLLGVSTDWLLGYNLETDTMISATVFFSGMPGYTKRAHSMPAVELVSWAKGFQIQVTESVLGFDGIPVKYIGDGFLCFFAGSGHQHRAVRAALRAKSVVSEELMIGLHSGELYFGVFGHPDYATRDIMGDCVNIAARVMGWTGKTESGIAASGAVMRGLLGKVDCTRNRVELKGISEPMDLYEIHGIMSD